MLAAGVSPYSGRRLPAQLADLWIHRPAGAAGALLCQAPSLTGRRGQSHPSASPYRLRWEGGLALYNLLRFGSPLDFGSSYQLTVSDIHYNTPVPAGKPGSLPLYYFFLQPLTIHGHFPLSRPLAAFSCWSKTTTLTTPLPALWPTPISGWRWPLPSSPAAKRRSRPLSPLSAGVVYSLTLLLPLGMALLFLLLRGQSLPLHRRRAAHCGSGCLLRRRELDTGPHQKDWRSLSCLVLGMLLLAGSPSVRHLLGVNRGSTPPFSTASRRLSGSAAHAGMVDVTAARCGHVRSKSIDTGDFP